MLWLACWFLLPCRYFFALVCAVGGGGAPFAVLVELGVVEQRYQAALEVLSDGATVTDVARRYGAVRQTVHGWLRKYAAQGLAGLVDQPSRPRSRRRWLGRLARCVAEFNESGEARCRGTREGRSDCSCCLGRRDGTGESRVRCAHEMRMFIGRCPELGPVSDWLTDDGILLSRNRSGVGRECGRM
jgi:transposase-like protein